MGAMKEIGIGIIYGVYERNSNRKATFLLILISISIFSLFSNFKFIVKNIYISIVKIYLFSIFAHFKFIVLHKGRFIY